MILRITIVILVLLSTFYNVDAQLITGRSEKEVNFREGPGTDFRVTHTIDHSNLLVILPGEKKNGFSEVFDVETSTLGYVYESLIHKDDTLNISSPKCFEIISESDEGDIEIILVNRIPETLFVWINNRSYTILPNEKVTLVFDEELITYFSSAPGTFPIFGKETLKKGNIYRWDFSL